jgi:hypothetical protein
MSMSVLAPENGTLSIKSAANANPIRPATTIPVIVMALGMGEKSSILNADKEPGFVGKLLVGPFCRKGPLPVCLLFTVSQGPVRQAGPNFSY